MAKKKSYKRSSSDSSRNSDHSRENSRHRHERREDRGTTRKEDSRREDDRGRRRENHRDDRDKSRSQSKGSSRFEDRFAVVQQQSRIDYSSEEESHSKISKQKSKSAESGGDKKKSRSRSRDRLEDDDSMRNGRSGTPRKSRHSKYDDRSDLSDDPDRRVNDPKNSEKKKGKVSKEERAARYESDASYQGTSRSKSRKKDTPGSKRLDDDSEGKELTPKSTKRDKRSEGEFNRGFEKSERTGLQTSEYDSEDSRRGRSRPKSRTNNLPRDDMNASGTDRKTAHREKSTSPTRSEDDFQRPDRTPRSRRDDDRSEEEADRYKNSGVQLRPAEGKRAPRDPNQRNGMVLPNERPEELTFRARELNNVPDPRSALCQRTDIALGVMDTRRDLADTDAFLFESPKGRRISTYMAAAISVIEALLGLGCGIFLLIDAEKQGIEDYKTYMVYTYMILHGLALVSGLLLIWANKECQLDLMVAWIAVQISTGVVFISGTALFLLLGLLNENVPIQKLLVGVPFIYFSSVFLIFIVLKVLTVAVVILRYQKLTFMPGMRVPPADRTGQRWTEYQPPPEESRMPPIADVHSETRDVETEPETPTAPTLPRVPSAEKSTPSKTPPPPPRRVDSINDDRATTEAVPKRPAAPEDPSLPDRADSNRNGSVRSSSSLSTLVPEPPRTTIPRVAPGKGLYSRPSTAEGRAPSPRRQVHSQAMPSNLEDEPPSTPSQYHASRGERSSLRPEPGPSHLSRETPHSRYEPSYTREQPTYEGHDPYFRESAGPYPTQQQSYARDRSPYTQSSHRDSENATSRRDPVPRPIPAERPSLAARSGHERQQHSDSIPVKSATRPKYLPTGAVPAVGSPEEWGKNHHLYAYGMPRSRQSEALPGGIRRHEDVYEPEPDY